MKKFISVAILASMILTMAANFTALGAWFRDYVYIPLGGNRKGFSVQIRNIAVVWLLTCIWHGASRSFCADISAARCFR